MSETAPAQGLTVRVLATGEEADGILVDELQAAVARGPRPLIGFATGATFARLLGHLQGELRSGMLGGRAFAATHLDEYLGFGPERPGGMVHELVTRCPPLAEMLAAGTFLPVPSDGSDAGLAAHEAALREHGGIALQLLGVGRNGHLAFHEPGTPFDRHFHVAELAPGTREDARARFAPAEPPTHAATAGVASVLAAGRLVLCAFGRSKAAAVRAMLHDPIGPSCPATAIRLHGNALVLLDREAAAGLPPGRQLAGTAAG